MDKIVYGFTGRKLRGKRS